MLRRILLYLSDAGWARRLVRNWRLARRVSSRFIAGETLDEACEVVRRLNQKGMYTSLDHLGENVTNTEEADVARDDYTHMLQRISDTDLQSNISVKLSQLGLGVDFERCLYNIHAIVSHAASLSIMVRIDMEDSSTVDRTLEIFRELRHSGLDNVGLVLQAYLFRTQEDLNALSPLHAHVRICKGAYNEPAEVAFPRKSDVDCNFDCLSSQLLDFAKSTAEQTATSGKYPPIPAIATHDERRIAHAVHHAETIEMPKGSIEFQMLYGIRPDLQNRLAESGFPVRVYVPFGSEWYPYFVRRLAERPANLRFFLSHLVRRKGNES
ncbi:MAG: proline dehydrogenase family protein [Anaerolineales bacterium]